jgi:hypothetical protein
MKITICASIEFTEKIQEIQKQLEGFGHKVKIPFTAERIIKGELNLKEFLADKKRNGDSKFREIVTQKSFADPIKRYFKIIAKGDVILVLNFSKNGISN